MLLTVHAWLTHCVTAYVFPRWPVLRRLTVSRWAKASTSLELSLRRVLNWTSVTLGLAVKLLTGLLIVSVVFSWLADGIWSNCTSQ